jgi:hypothetical protein
MGATLFTSLLFKIKPNNQTFPDARMADQVKTAGVKTFAWGYNVPDFPYHSQEELMGSWDAVVVIPTYERFILDTGCSDYKHWNIPRSNIVEAS